MQKKEYTLHKCKLGYHLKYGTKTVAHIWQVGGQYYACSIDARNKTHGDILGPFASEQLATMHFRVYE